MHFPSERMMSLLGLAEAGIWADRVNDARDVVLVVKLNTDTLKWIQRGVPVNLLVGHVAVGDEVIRVLGLEVFDCKTDPLLPNLVQVQDWEVEGFDALLGLHRFPVHFHNEQPFVSVLDATGSLPRDVVADYASKRRNVRLHTKPAITSLFRQAQDTFERCLSNGDVTGVDLFRWPLTLENPVWNSVEVPDAGTFVPEATNEGASHENLLVHVLKPNFPGKVFAPPLIQDKGQTRELCDVLAVDESAFLIEAKACSVFDKSMDQTSERKASSVRKQFEKGLGQLQGAVTRMESGVELLNPEAHGERLEASRFRTIHCIVLVSNTSFALPWLEIGAQLADASQPPRVYFHFISLMELQRMVAFSQSSKELNQMLMRRAEVIASSRDAKVATEFVPALPTLINPPDPRSGSQALQFTWTGEDSADHLLRLFSRMERLMLQREFTGRLDYWHRVRLVRGIPGLDVGITVSGPQCPDGWWVEVGNELFSRIGHPVLATPVEKSLEQVKAFDRAGWDRVLTIEFRAGLPVAKRGYD